MCTLNHYMTSHISVAEESMHPVICTIIYKEIKSLLVGVKETLGTLLIFIVHTVLSHLQFFAIHA